MEPPHQQKLRVIAPVTTLRCQAPHRKPYISVRRRVVKVARHDSDHRTRLSVQLELPTDNILSTGETPLPERVADDDNGRSSGEVFLRRKRATNRGPKPEYVEEVQRHSSERDALRLFFRSEVPFALCVGGQIVEGAEPIPVVEVFRHRGHPDRWLVPERNDPLRVRIRQRPEQNRIYHTEDCGVRARAERDDRNDGSRKDRPAGKCPQRVTQILRERRGPCCAGALGQGVFASAQSFPRR